MDLWDTIKWVNTNIVGILEEEREKGAEILFEEIMILNLPNLKDINTNIQEAQWIPSIMNSKRPTPRHLIIKLSKDKERMLKAARENDLSHTRNPHSETLEARRQWANIFKVLEAKNLSAIESTPLTGKTVLQSEGEIKTLLTHPPFAPQNRLREFVFTRPALSGCWNAGEGPAGWKEWTGDNNLKPYEDSKFSVQVNAWAIIKASM